MNIFKRRQFGDIISYEAGFGPLGAPLMTVHMFLVGAVLIDTGQRNMRKTIVDALAGEKIDRILLTHHHEDHSGNAAALSRAHNVDVTGHPLTAEKMKQYYRIFPYQHLVWGKADPVAVSPLPDKVEAGAFRLLPIHTPGHSKDHTVFLEQHRGWLFSGDLYLGDRIKYFRADEIITDQIRSLKKVLAHDFDVLVCAHNPRWEDGHRRLERKLNFLEDLYGEINGLLEKGYSPKEIIRMMRNREVRTVKLMCLGNVSFANIVRSCAAPAGS
jgi:glyoxylase-like metal-dependent hydrolase (beta-lactamase superfamily II)